MKLSFGLASISLIIAGITISATQAQQEAAVGEQCKPKCPMASDMECVKQADEKCIRDADQLSVKAKQAADSGNKTQMKAALEDTVKTLDTIKADRRKSIATTYKLQARTDAVLEQANKVKGEVSRLEYLLQDTNPELPHQIMAP